MAISALDGFRGWVTPLLLALAASGGNGEDTTIVKAAHHQVCCLRSHVPKPQASRLSGNAVKDWAELLTGFINNAYSDDCLHVYGVGEMALHGPENEMPSLEHIGEDDDDWKFEHRVATFGPSGTSGRDAQCASMALLLPVPVKSSLDFFMPDFLDEMTQRRPSIRMELGAAKFYNHRYGNLDVVNYVREKRLFYEYEDAYPIGNDFSSFNFATDDALQKVVSRGFCNDEHFDCSSRLAFVEAVTGARVPEAYELGLVTKDEIKSLLTLKKLESIDFAKKMEKLKFEVENPQTYAEEKVALARKVHAVTWSHMVPRQALERLQKGPPSKGIKGTKMKKGSSGGASRDASRLTQTSPSYDLSTFDENEFNRFVASARAFTKKDRNRMSSAFSSTQIIEKFPQGRRDRGNENDLRSKQPSKLRGDDVVSPRQITDFLLVNSLLAVSKSKYSDFVGSGALQKLARTSMPIFSVCGKAIEWKSGRPPSKPTSDWLSSMLRFTVTNFEHASFEHRKLNEVDSQGDLSDSSQCAILALLGVAEECFKLFSRQPFDMIFGIITREQMVKETSNYQLLKDTRLSYVSAASQVDPWKSTEDSSEWLLGRLFSHIGYSIKKKVESPGGSKRARSLKSGKSRKASAFVRPW